MISSWRRSSRSGTAGDAFCVQAALVTDTSDVDRLASTDTVTRFDLRRGDLTGVHVYLRGTAEVSAELARLVGADNGIVPADGARDLFQDVLRAMAPESEAAREVLRRGTPAFLESHLDRMLSETGLPIPLPPAAGGEPQRVTVLLHAVADRTGAGFARERVDAEYELRYERGTARDERQTLSLPQGVGLLVSTAPAEPLRWVGDASGAPPARVLGFEEDLTMQVNARLRGHLSVGREEVMRVWEQLRDERSEVALPRSVSGRADAVAQAIQLGEERSEEAFRLSAGTTLGGVTVDLGIDLPSVSAPAESSQSGRSSAHRPDAPPPRPVRLPKSVRWADEQGGTLAEVQDEDVTAAEAVPEPVPLRDLVPIEDLLAGTQVGLVDGRVAGIWLPGAPETAPAFSPETLAWLNPPPRSVFVFGAVRDGKVMVGDQEVPEAALATAIASRAPGLAPILWMSEAGAVAGPLAERLGTPVLASPHHVRFDQKSGSLMSSRPFAGPGNQPVDEWFRLYLPGFAEGQPIYPALPVVWTDDTAGGTRPPQPPVPVDVTGHPLTMDPRVLSIGVPRAGLPNIPQLIRELQKAVRAARVTVPDDVWTGLPLRLLANYPYLLDGPDKQGNGGLLVPLGPIELLVSLDPGDPHTVTNPAGSTTAPSTLPPVDGDEEFRATGSINAVYATGANSESHSGTTESARGALSLTFGIGATPHVLQVVRAGVSLSGTANRSDRTTNHVFDTEGGHVEDNRAEATMVAFTPNWSFKVRTDQYQTWEKIKVRRVPDTAAEKLLLWIPGHYLEKAPDQVTATGDGVKTDRLPDTFFASGMTGLPQLLDQVAAQLQDQGVDLRIGGVTRAELTQKLWNLNAHLDKAVNDKKRGYRFFLHNESGRPIASVELHAERVPFGDPRVGDTSDRSHLENVKVAIDGTGGSHTVGHSSTLTGSVEFDLLPNPLIPDLGLGVSGYLSAAWSNSDGVSAGRTGLWVVVPRFAGNTNAYQVRFAYTATTKVRGGKKKPPARTTEPVLGQALVRLPEPAAFEHGFPIDKEALKVHPGEAHTVPYKAEAVRRTGKREGDPDEKTPPAHLAAGKGVGMGLVQVADSTVEELLTRLRPLLRERGFLPKDEDDEFGGRRWWQHGNDLDSRLDNLLLLEKMISGRGLDSHYDEIHQDGMTFTLHHRQGFSGMDFDADSAKITIRATKNPDHDPKFLRSTADYHTVNLSMGMDTGGHSTAGSRKLALGVKFKALFEWFKNGLTGVELQRTVGASDAVTFLNNRPELLEYPGVVDEWELTSDYEVTVEYQHSGTYGEVHTGARDPDPIALDAQVALARLLPIGAGEPAGPTTKEATPPAALKQALPYFADFSGMREAAQALLEGLTGPAGAADQEVGALAGTTALRAHLKEILNGEYTTDQLFDSGFFRNTLAALNISGAMGRTTYVDATKDKFVLGLIKLWLSVASTTDTTSKGITVDELDLAFGGVGQHHDAEGHPKGMANLTGEVDLSRHWQWNRSRTGTRTAGTELIQLDFNRAYLYQTTVDYTVAGRREKHAKLLPGSERSGERQVPDRSEDEHRPGRLMMYLLPEPEALTQYGDGVLPVSDAQLADALDRWLKGYESGSADGDAAGLRLGGDLVAKVLTRWKNDVPRLPDGIGADRDRLAAKLAELHANGALPVVDSRTRETFNERFQLTLADRDAEFANMEMPEYLTRADRENRVLGHHGVHDLTYDNGRSTFQIVKKQVDKVAPGLLAADPEVWDGRGRKIGRLQGGIDSLQAVLARGRDEGMLEDVVSPNGQKFYLVNPTGWFLSDVVEISLADVLTSDPEVRDYKPGTGNENYGHAYDSTSETRSRDASRTFTLGRFSVGRAAHADDAPADPPPSGSGAGVLRLNEGHHRSVTRSDKAVDEQTVYDWSGHYRVRFRHELTVGIRRLDMAGRPLNNRLMHWFDRWTHHGAADTVTEAGWLELQVPRALAEAGAMRGPAPVRNLVPLPALPGNAYVTGTLLGDAVPAGMKLLDKVFGRKADSIGTRSNMSLPTRLSPTHLRNHIRQMTGGKRYKVGEHLFIPGHSSDRATMWLAGDLYDMDVIAPIKKGTGTGHYDKAESGTTAGAASDRWRLGVEAGGNASGTIEPHAQPRTLEGGTSQSRGTSAGESAAGTENYRREQHVKEQGPVFVVRLRGRFRLEAEKFRHHLWRKRTPRGTFHSDPITGDVYAVIGRSQVELLRAQLAEATEKTRAHSAAWREPEASFDLGPLLVEAARKNLDASRAHQGVARQLRERVRRPHAGEPSIVLTDDARNRDELAFRAVVSWAVRTMRSTLAAARVYDPTIETPRSLGVYQRYLDMLPHVPGTLTRSLAEETDAIIAETRRIHALHPDNPKGGLAPLPPEVAVLGLDSVHLARDVAHELDAYVRLDVTREDGTVERRRWVDPDGRVHTFHPVTGQAHPAAPGAVPPVFDGVALSADVAEEVGLLPGRLRPDVETYGIDRLELGRTYRRSWLHQQTFEQALAGEIGRRRSRLDAVHPGLPELLTRARDLEHHARSETRRLTERQETLLRDIADTAQALHEQDRGLLDTFDPAAGTTVRPGEAKRDRLERRLADLSEEDVRLTRDLADVRGREHEVAGLAEDLRTLARDGDDTVRARWDERAVRSATDRLGTLEDQTGLRTEAVAERIGLAYRAWSTGTVLEGASRLQRRLRDAGPGAVSLVVTEGPRGDFARFIAVNRGGRVRWFDDASGREAGPPTDASAVSAASLDLDPAGTVIDPPEELRAMDPDAVAFPRLRSAALGRVEEAASAAAGRAAPPSPAPVLVDDPLPGDPHLYENEDGRYRVGPHGLRSGWTPVGPLSAYTPLAWLTRGAPATGLSDQDVVRSDLDNAVAFLVQATRTATPADAVRTFLTRTTGRVVEPSDALPHDLPAGTWIWFSGEEFTGTAVVRPDRRYRIHMPGVRATGVRSDEGVRSMMGGGPYAFVIARPQDAETTTTGRPAGPHVASRPASSRSSGVLERSASGSAAQASAAPALPSRQGAGFTHWLSTWFTRGTPPAPFPEGGVRDVDDLLALADRGPIEIAVPHGLHDRRVPVGLPSSEGWRALLGYGDVTWVLLGDESDPRDTFVSRAEGPGNAPWRYVLDDAGQVTGAFLMGDQRGTREPRGYVLNPAAGRPPAGETAPGRHEDLERALRDAGLGPVADVLRDGGVPQLQLTDRLRERLDGPGAGGADPLSRTLAKAMDEIPVVAADGSRPRPGDTGLDGGAPEKRFVVDHDGRVRSPSRPWHHVVHPREPVELAARRGTGPGTVRKTPGLEVVYHEVTNALTHQLRSAGAHDRLSAAERRRLTTALAAKFGVPSLREAYPELLGGGSVVHETRVGEYVFTVTLGAELRALRAEPVVSGRTTRFEYEAVYTLAVTTRRGAVVAAQVRELSGDGYRTTVTVPNTDLPSDPIPADEIVAFGEREQAASTVEDDAPSRSTDAQAVRLARLTLRPSRVQGLIPALVELAPQETSVAAAPGAAPAPDQVRAYLADTLARDLDRPGARRRHWPLLEADIRRLKATLRPGPEPLTDAARRELIGRLRTPEAGSDVIAALAAGRVFGLAVTLVLPDGSLAEAGTSSGRSVVLVRLPGTGDWAATLPVTPPAPPAAPEAGMNRPGPGRTRVVPAAFFDAPRPARLD